MTSSITHAEFAMAAHDIQAIRHELLLSAFCALARSLPQECRLQVAQAMSSSTQQLAADAPTLQDEALAADLARMLGALGCLPGLGVQPATAV